MVRGKLRWTGEQEPTANQIANEKKGKSSVEKERQM